MKLKVIIVGAGEVGFHIAQRLSEENQDVVLIDKEAEQIKRVSDNLDVQGFFGIGNQPSNFKGYRRQGSQYVVGDNRQR